MPIQAVTTRDSVKSDDRKKDDDAQKTVAELNASGKINEVVFVLVDGKAKLRRVKTGIQDSQYIEIKEGLKEGEEIISGPYAAVSRTLKNDMAVKVVSKEELFEKEKK
jgi:HlyD family secretion protein